MESESSRQALNVIPPTSSSTPGVGVTAIITSTTDLVVDLFDSNGNAYNGFFFRYLNLTAVGGDVYFLFSASTTPTIDQTVSGTTVATGTTTAVPDILKDGVTSAMRLNPTDHRYLHLKAASGTPIVRIRPSSEPRVSYGY